MILNPSSATLWVKIRELYISGNPKTVDSWRISYSYWKKHLVNTSCGLPTMTSGSPILLVDAQLCDVGSWVGDVQVNTVFRATNRIEKNPLPQLGDLGLRLLRCPRVYQSNAAKLGLRLAWSTDVLYVLEEKSFFEFYDCCIVLKQILGPGFRTIPGVSYSAGIDDAEYQIKTLDSTSPQLHYWPFARRSISSIFLQRGLIFGKR